MEKLRVLESLPKGTQFQYILYNLQHFQEINNDLPRVHYYLIQGANVLGQVVFEMEEGIAHSHIRSPFGGFFIPEPIKKEGLLFFIIEVERRLKALQINEVRLHQAPSNFFKQNVSEALHLFGYTHQQDRLYQMIAVTDQAFEDQLHEMELRKLRKCKEMGFSVEMVKSSNLKELFDFILAQRIEKGFAFSMTWQMLKEYQEAFPENYLGIEVRFEGSIIAGTILIKEHESVVYNFAPAHLMKYNRFSPIVLLTEGIYNWAHDQGMAFVNLGTSYLGEEQNESLFSFKEKLGAKSFIAHTFQKKLNSY